MTTICQSRRYPPSKGVRIWLRGTVKPRLDPVPDGGRGRRSHGENPAIPNHTSPPAPAAPSSPEINKFIKNKLFCAIINWKFKCDEKCVIANIFESSKHFKNVHFRKFEFIL
jgi:hypothetical protein